MEYYKEGDLVRVLPLGDVKGAFKGTLVKFIAYLADDVSRVETIEDVQVEDQVIIKGTRCMVHTHCLELPSSNKNRSFKQMLKQ
jgi:hypothetical protein